MKNYSKLKKAFADDPEVLRQLAHEEAMNGMKERNAVEIAMLIKKGDKGDTPKKGVDYFTPKEVQEVTNYVKETVKEEVRPIKGKDYFDGLPGEPGKNADETKILKKLLREIPTAGEILAQVKVPAPQEIDQEELINKILKAIPEQKILTIDEIIKELKKKPVLELRDIKGARLDGRLDGKASGGYNMNDNRWHGGGLDSVVTDGVTITGNGTAASPLVGTAASDTYKLKISAADTTGGYGEDKILAGGGITVTKGNVGGNETLTIAAPGSTTDEKVKVSALDTTPGYLTDKLVAGTRVAFVASGAGNETLTINVSETDTLNSVCNRGNTTLSAITAGGIRSGSIGVTGQYSMYKNIGLGVDWILSLNPNAAQSANLDFYFPAAYPGGTYFMKVSTLGVMSYDSTTYLASGSALLLDQTSSQTIINGQPIWDTLTASLLVATDGSKKFQSLTTGTYPSLTEISYVKGVTSALQTQLNNKLTNTGVGTTTTVWHGNAGGLGSFGPVIEDDISLSNVTTNNADLTKHGFLDQLPGGTTVFKRGDGAWAAPASVAVPNGYYTIAQAFTANVEVILTHNFGAYPVIQAFEPATFNMIVPYVVRQVDTDNVGITFTSSATYTIVMTLGAPPFSALTITAVNYVVLADDYTIKVTAANKTVTLPTAVGRTGKIFIIKNSSAGICDVLFTGGQNADGYTDVTIPATNSYTFISDGSNYIIT